MDIQDGPWIWRSKGPEEEQFGELRCFIMGGRIALVLWAIQRDGQKHLDRLTEYHSLADIRYEPFKHLGSFGLKTFLRQRQPWEIHPLASNIRYLQRP